ncbi:unnamed protein product, partial [Chrysoparadoxa australica]
NLDVAWVAPTAGQAEKYRLSKIWASGEGDFFRTGLQEISSLGAGVYLYFWLQMCMAVLFLLFGLLSIPAMVFNAAGNGGFAMASKDYDSLGLVRLSLGNQGLNPELITPGSCFSEDFSTGFVDCSGRTSNIYGSQVPAHKIGVIMGMMELVVVWLFIVFTKWLQRKMAAKIDDIDAANATPQDYAIFVRGLPMDATEHEVLEHFNALYDLSGRRPSYPRGMSMNGAAVLVGSICAVVFSILLINPIGLVIGAFLGVVLRVLQYGRWVTVLCGVEVMVSRHPDTFRCWRKQTCSLQLAPRSTAAFILSLSLLLTSLLTADSYLTAATSVACSATKLTPSSSSATPANCTANTQASYVGHTQGGMGEEAREVSQFVPVRFPKPVQDTSNTMDPRSRITLKPRGRIVLPRYADKWVADVCLTHPIEGALRPLLSQEKTLKKLVTSKAKMRKWKTLGDEERLRKAERRVAKLVEKEKKLSEFARKGASPEASTKCTGAFVMFENEESQRRAIHDYRKSHRWFAHKFQPTPLRFLDKVSSPPSHHCSLPSFSCHSPGTMRTAASHSHLLPHPPFQPSNVQWENLFVPKREQALRRAFTSVVMLVLLICSFVTIYLAQVKQVETAKKIPDLGLCGLEAPASYYGTYTLPTELTIKAGEQELVSSCQARFGMDYTSLSWEASGVPLSVLPTLLKPDGTTVSRASFEVLRGLNLCDDTCHSSRSSETCSSLACGIPEWEAQGFLCKEYPSATLVGCYCLAQLESNIDEFGLTEGAKMVYTDDQACTEFIQSYLAAQAIKAVAVLIVVVVNALLQTVMRALAKFERHSSFSDFTSSITLKLALAQFVNTALIVLVVNSAYTGGGSAFLHQLGVLNGPYGDFERQWYATVGVAVSMTMLINIVVPHIGPFFSGTIVAPIKRALARRSAVTQTELNHAYHPPRFAIEARFAFMIQQVTMITALYGGGIPVLYPIAAANLTACFFLDK